MSKICFANKGSQCKALTVTRCTGDGCSFYKTSKEQSLDIKRVYARIASLDKAVQKYISDTYYKGRYPWLEEGDARGC